MLYDPIKAVLFVSIIFVVGAFLISYLSVSNNNRNSGDNLWKVFWIEVGTVSLFLIPVFAGNIVFITFLLLFNYRAQFEIFSLYKTSQSFLFYLPGFLISTFIVLLATVNKNYLFLPVVLLGIFFVIELIQHFKNTVFLKITNCTLLITISITSLVIIYHLENGMLLVIYIYLIAETNDAFAMIFGKRIGKRRIFSNISPNKTLEGLLIGICFATTTGLIFNYYFKLYTVIESIVVILVIETGAIIGDILFSYYKRKNNVKDFFPLYKDVNGILDIFDSFIISSIFFYCYILIVQLPGL